ncbi:MAG: ATP-binding cassette domain-containing protein [Propionibacteriales bacterium]|nr:ATP-binding cassette domain-containing protein [Propionibacteriales bacterium]
MTGSSASVGPGAATADLAPGRPVISAQGVSKRFRRKDQVVTAIKDVDLDVSSGEFVCIVGPSGCGKSTLLNMSAGLMEPSKGKLLFAGEPVTGPNTSVGYITQKDNLMPWHTVEGNIGLALHIRKTDKAKARARVAEMIEMVGLQGFEKSYPGELSGGMRKRVTLARTLAYDPPVLLADEPFGALDAQLKLVMQAEMQRIWAETGKTILFVTHDISEAVALGDRVIVMSSRPGQVKVDRRIDFPRPRDVFKIRHQPGFADLAEELWDILAADMHSGEDM